MSEEEIVVVEENEEQEIAAVEESGEQEIATMENEMYDLRHSLLLERELPNQHPMSAINGLKTTGDGSKYLSNDGTYKTVVIPEVPVEDVKVNGESVVDANKIAQVTIPEVQGQLIVDYYSNLPTGKANGTKARVLNSESSASWVTPTSIASQDNPILKFVEEPPQPASLPNDICFIWQGEYDYQFLNDEFISGGAIVLLTPEENAYVYVWQNTSLMGLDLTANSWNYVIGAMTENPTSGGVVDYSQIPFPTTGTIGDISDIANLLYPYMLILDTTPVVHLEGDYVYNGTDWLFLPYNLVTTSEGATKYLAGDGEYKTPEVAAVRYDTANQGLTEEEKSNARTNINAVPTARMINSKPLNTDIVIDANDVGAVKSDWGIDNANKNLVTDATGNVALSDYALGQISVNTYADLPSGVPQGTSAYVLNDSSVSDWIDATSLEEDEEYEGLRFSENVSFPATPPLSQPYLTTNEGEYTIDYSTLGDQPVMMYMKRATGDYYVYIETGNSYFGFEFQAGWSKIENFGTADMAVYPITWEDIPFASTNLIVTYIDSEAEECLLPILQTQESVSATSGQYIYLNNEWIYYESIPITSPLYTLFANSWVNKMQTINVPNNDERRNTIDVVLSSAQDWANCGVLCIARTDTTLTFSCGSIPFNNLYFKITSEVIKNANS